MIIHDSLATTFSVLFCITLVSCNLFKTRTPEEPSQQSSNYIPPTTPSIVFQNMMNAFRDKNSENYYNSFADSSTSDYSFTFEPTYQAQLKYSGVFTSWTKESEKEYFDNIRWKLQSGAVPTLEFDTLIQQGIATDSVQYEAIYKLTVLHTQSNIPTQAKGKAQFFLVSNRSRYWFIHHWIDIAMDQNDFTWSELKGAFAH